ncbi:hypothetical protein HDU67_009909 [Dinochytrium kinnereticum]|nr:hypothetical protein HDU67_009909 [Dinochytrium kinnereticum]
MPEKSKGLAMPSLPGRSFSVQHRPSDGSTAIARAGGGDTSVQKVAGSVGSAGRPLSAFGADDPAHIVEMANAVASRDTETFITQRGGKLLSPKYCIDDDVVVFWGFRLQGNHLYVPVVQNEFPVCVVKESFFDTLKNDILRNQWAR